MEIPVRIDTCPIVDSVIEIRFNTNIFPNAVFGLIFNALRNEYPHAEKLPILQLPEQLRDVDPNFKHKAHYKIISKDNFSVQIGPDMIALGSPIPYPGWDTLSGKLFYVIDEVFKIGIIDQVTRLGIRYINFFDYNIYDKVNLTINVKSDVLGATNTTLRTELEKAGFLNTLHISNDAKRIVDNQQIAGSIIDIDTFKIYNETNFHSIYKEEIEKAHNTEKEIFFGLLKTEFLDSLKPTYS